ncbi:Rapamycin insensitive companion of mTOR N term Rapamycin insensitive companion of mTOR middle domain [Trypanosoma vivax]|nr:hypothetical protein TRVL_00019 [Trypanosoma vivax]KAH8609137.1 Rapamycin insensitive companion of mTOR N term Rapamycin insensitive companion of mTOR middle domain [Trypanosoma vivax]
MATGSLSPEAVQLLQGFNIQLKDYSKARVCYEKLCCELSGKISTGDEGDEAVAETEQTLQRLQSAWKEYTTVAQVYFRKIFTAALDDLSGESQVTLSATQRAEKLNELCITGEKWYIRNEDVFELKQFDRLAVIVARALDSSSCVMRLLGLQLARIFAADTVFIHTLFSKYGAELIGLCFDRENGTELEYALDLSARFIELHKSTKKQYPDFPFGWIYRIASLLDLQDPVPNVLPKRRKQALCVAVKLLQVFPHMATAASLHITLLRYCIEKGTATVDEIQDILQVILDMFDSPETRQYLNYNDLDVLYGPFLYTTHTSSSEYLALMNGAMDVLAMVMRTWVGVFWTCSETKGLRAIIDVLHLPCDLDRKMVLITFFNRLLCLLAPHRGITPMERWQGITEKKRRPFSVSTGDRAELNNPLALSHSSLPACEAHEGENSSQFGIADMTEEHDEFVPTTKAIGYHVLDPILGCILLMLSHHGLPIALVSIIQDCTSSSILTQAASSLLQDFLTLMDTVLPEKPVKWLHTALNKAVGRLALEGDLSIEGVLPSCILQLKRATKGLTTTATVAVGNIVREDGVSAPSSAAVTYGLGTLEQDDAAFKKLLDDTNVEKGAGFRSWNHDLLLLLFQGPLKGMRRFRWVLSETRFFHKIVTFYRPSPTSERESFLALQGKDVTLQMCTLGLVMLDLFLSTREGTKALDSFGFTAAFAACLEDVIHGTPSVLNQERLETPVGQTLLRMIGRYSTTANGLVAMREHNICVSIKKMFSELAGERASAPPQCDTLRSVCLHLLRRLHLGTVPNYGVCEDIRQSFRAALCSDSSSIRLCAVKQLRESLWRDFSTSMRWGIETLVHALHDDVLSVVECAFKFLLNICLCSDEALDYFISLSPTVLMESDAIRDNAELLNLNTLLYCIVGRPSGFRFLQYYGWVEQELRRWEEVESANHVRIVERMQSGKPPEASSDFREGMSALFRHRHNRTFSESALVYGVTGVCASTHNDFPSVSLSSGIFPSHFAAALCTSNEGCTFFKHSHLWQRSVQCILDQPMPPDIVHDSSVCGYRNSSDDDEDSYCDDDEKVLNEEDPSLVGRWGIESGKTKELNRDEMQALRLSQKHHLPCSESAKLLSASRGYKSGGQGYTLECVGDVAKLKDAILCVCHAASSDTGFTLLRSVPMLLKQLLALTNFADTATVRSICIVGKCLIARSKRCADQLSEMSYYILNEGNAYTSADGVPYSVAFAHTHPATWTAIGRRSNLSRNSCSLPYFSHLQYEGEHYGGASSTSIPIEEGSDVTPRDVTSPTRSSAQGTPTAMTSGDGATDLMSGTIRRILDSAIALPNPVLRDAAKHKLEHALKHQPQVFLSPTVRFMLMRCSQTYRLPHAERKFIASLLENAPLTKPVPSNRKAVVVVPQ